MALGDILKLVILIQVVSSAAGNVTSSDIIYTLYTPKFPFGINMTIDQASVLNTTDFEGFYRVTYFIVFGLENPSTRDDYYIKDKLLLLLEGNVFVVDWTALAQTKMTPREKVILLGDYMSEFIDLLDYFYGLLLIKVGFVASSLAAHAAGRSCINSNYMISDIHALDPSKLEPNPFEFLTPNVSLYLQVIHTNGGQQGIAESFGRTDFYPNGGKIQPGCGTDENGDCSHERATAYFAEGLISEGFVGHNCSSYENYSQGLCKQNTIAWLGGINDQYRPIGNFYLDTNDKPPYARG